MQKKFEATFELRGGSAARAEICEDCSTEAAGGLILTQTSLFDQS